MRWLCEKELVGAGEDLRRYCSWVQQRHSLSGFHSPLAPPSPAGLPSWPAGLHPLLCVAPGCSLGTQSPATQQKEQAGLEVQAGREGLLNVNCILTSWLVTSILMTFGSQLTAPGQIEREG